MCKTRKFVLFPEVYTQFRLATDRLQHFVYNDQVTESDR